MALDLGDSSPRDAHMQGEPTQDAGDAVAGCAGLLDRDVDRPSTKAHAWIPCWHHEVTRRVLGCGRGSLERMMTRRRPGSHGGCLSDLKRDLHCGFVELGGSVSVSS